MWQPSENLRFVPPLASTPCDRPVRRAARRAPWIARSASVCDGNSPVRMPARWRPFDEPAVSIARMFAAPARGDRAPMRSRRPKPTQRYRSTPSPPAGTLTDQARLLASACRRGRMARLRRAAHHAPETSMPIRPLHRPTLPRSVRSRPLFLAGALVIAIAAGTLGTLPAAASDRVVVVQAGQTLSQIAAAHGTTVERLVALNHIADPNRIYVGQRLRVRPAPTSSARPAHRARLVVHRVAYGETLTGIAARYGTTIGALVIRNHLADASRIYAGQLLRISGTHRQARRAHGRVAAGTPCPDGDARRARRRDAVRHRPQLSRDGGRHRRRQPAGQPVLHQDRAAAAHSRGAAVAAGAAAATTRRSLGSACRPRWRPSFGSAVACGS